MLQHGSFAGPKWPKGHKVESVSALYRPLHNNNTSQRLSYLSRETFIGSVSAFKLKSRNRKSFHSAQSKYKTDGEIRLTTESAATLFADNEGASHRLTKLRKDFLKV